MNQATGYPEYSYYGYISQARPFGEVMQASTLPNEVAMEIHPTPGE